MNLQEIIVRPVGHSEEAIFQQLMGTHHYLGALPKIGNTLWYVATYQNDWLALLVFSAAALKCSVRERWIGWDYAFGGYNDNRYKRNSKRCIETITFRKSKSC